MDDLPIAGGATRILELECNLDEVIGAIATRTEAEQRGSVLYATRVDELGTLRLVEISEWLAAVIKACDGSRTVARVLDRLADDLPQLDDEAKRYVSGRLLIGAQTAGFVGIYRQTATPPNLSS